MTTTFDDGVPMRRFSKDWLGHYWLPLMVGYDLLEAPLFWLHGTVWDGISTAAVIPVTLLMLHGVRHEVKLCAPCAVKIPLDGHEAARARRRTLRAVHWAARRHGWTMGRLSFRPSRAFLMLLVLVLAGYLLPKGPWWLVGNGIAFDAFFCSMILGNRIHQRLQPWCPQCRWGDGGEAEPSPDPSPSEGLVPAGSAS